MIRIHPNVEFSASCPVDQALLQIKDTLVPNLHCLANAVCPACGTNYYIDLPVGQAIWSPVMLNQLTAEVYDPLGVDWFSQPLRNGFLSPEKTEIVPIVHKFFDSDRIIVVNCLDFLYGHSLLKLLNVQRYLDNSPELGCCVLVPTQLKHLVPDGVAEIWEFPVPLKDGGKWYPSLANWVKEQVSSRKECFLSEAYSHPSNQVYDLRRFVQDLPDISKEVDVYEPVILFSYREDRLWGENVVQQQRNLQRLYDKLSSIFPEMLFVLVGFGQQSCIKASGAKLLDLRANKFDVERDRLWMAYMSAADCAIGVHGSNMLLPSGLAKSTVELVYTSRLGNTVQDFLFSHQILDPRDAVLYYRMLYGNNVLSDVYPSTVVSSIANVISFARRNSAWFKVGEDLQTLEFDITHQVFIQARNHLANQFSKSFVTQAVRKLAHFVLAVTD